MFRALMMMTTAVGLCACAQMKTAAEPTPNTAAQLQTIPAIASETDSLKHLARIAIDANSLYADAAKEADDAPLKTELAMLAEDRKDFAQALQARVAALGDKPAEHGEAVGTIHRSFTAVRELVQNDSIAAAGEVYRGEIYMIGELTKAMEGKLTPVSLALIQDELAKAKEGRDRIEAIKTRLDDAKQAEAAREQMLKDAKRDAG
jgi:uncharacterized protein (TIGR02284 family)